MARSILLVRHVYSFSLIVCQYSPEANILLEPDHWKDKSVRHVASIFIYTDRVEPFGDIH